MRIGVLRQLVHGMAALEAAVSAERGAFSLFALIEKDDWPQESSSWRLFVAAPWIWADERGALKHLRDRVRPYEDGWNPFAPRLSVQMVKANSPYLEEVWEYCSTENGMVEIYDVEILDVTARRGYIFASRRPAELPRMQTTP